ncbi:uroporphyrinogen-III synthase-like [Styela clava]
MNIILLKERKQTSDPYHIALKEFGNVIFIPVLSINFVNLDHFEKLLSQDTYDGIIFTSGNAVKATRTALEKIASSITKVSLQKNCYVVGKATDKLASEIGFKCSGSGCGNAEELAKLIIAENSSISSKGFLFPCGQLKRETLPNMLKEAEIKLTCQTVYETIEHPKIFEAIKNHKSQNINPTIAIFFSPSGVQFSLPKFKQVYGEDLNGFYCAAIGQTTSEALKQAGIQPCCVAEHPNPDSLYLSIKSFISSIENKS